MMMITRMNRWALYLWETKWLKFKIKALIMKRYSYINNGLSKNNLKLEKMHRKNSNVFVMKNF